MKRIIILGATSHIAKNLVYYLSDGYELTLFARNTAAVEKFITENINCASDIEIYDINYFENFRDKSDVLINCIGFGTPDKVVSAGYDLYRITEKFDNLAIEYILKNKETLYINFSSGAVYGTDFDSPVSEKSTTEIKINNIQTTDHYRLSKIYSESKHRSLKDLYIVDIRVFSFFSRFMDLNSNYLMSDIINSIKNKNVFKTSENDIVRDFVSPADLTQLVKLCINTKTINTVFDLYSKAPLTKSQLIDTMKEKFGLLYIVDKTASSASPTGVKSLYYSENYKALEIGFNPEFSSLESVVFESEIILKDKNNY